jgi:hypothetical protein
VTVKFLFRNTKGTVQVAEVDFVDTSLQATASVAMTDAMQDVIDKQRLLVLVHEAPMFWSRARSALGS